VERVYWWQLVAPGYGLIDSRGMAWRRRPSFFALKTMVSILEGSTFTRRVDFPNAHIFSFTKNGESCLVCWTAGSAFELNFPCAVKRIVGRDGHDEDFEENRVLIDGSPKYVFCEGDFIERNCCVVGGNQADDINNE
jgi:hypothetical protein